MPKNVAPPARTRGTVPAVAIVVVWSFFGDCPECRMPMELLSEDDDDAHLSKSEIVEEKLNSANYDVWMCSSCHCSQTVRYGAFFSRYSKCPACGAKTRSVSTAVISEPTNAMSGMKEITESCDNCDHKKQYRRSIPRTGSCPRPRRPIWAHRYPVTNYTDRNERDIFCDRGHLILIPFQTPFNS